jgi:hypothetical protein
MEGLGSLVCTARRWFSSSWIRRCSEAVDPAVFLACYKDVSRLLASKQDPNITHPGVMIQGVFKSMQRLRETHVDVNILDSRTNVCINLT